MKPNFTTNGMILRPSVDQVNAYLCCNYPPLPVLESIKSERHIPEQIIKSLQRLNQSKTCHVVAAAPPGLEGQRMRVSTTLMERKLMQSLSTLQGQLFIIIKYFIKRVIAKRVKGLKTYHAKNLLFYMLDKTPADDWQPQNLIKLLRQSLQLLLDSLTDAGSNKHQCMWHFFMRDAAVYLRKDHQHKCDIALVIREVLNELPELLAQFQQTLMKNSPSMIEFHPFLILPIINDLPVSESDTELEYHEIYDVVKQVLMMLSEQVPEVSEVIHLQLMEKYIRRIPDCATTVRESLRALMRLRSGEKLSNSLLVKNGRLEISSGIYVGSDKRAKVRQRTWDHLRQSDSAWNFIFNVDRIPRLEFLPDHMKMAFPWALQKNGEKFVHMNFYTLMKTLKLETKKLAGRDVSSTDLQRDFSDVFSGSADPQELLMVMYYCNDEDLLVQAIHSKREMISATGLSGFLLKYLDLKPNLRHKCVHATWEKFEVMVNAKLSQWQSSRAEKDQLTAEINRLRDCILQQYPNP